MIRHLFFRHHRIASEVVSVTVAICAAVVVGYLILIFTP